MELNLTFGPYGADAPNADFADSATSLYRWLMAEPELRGRAEVSVESAQSAEGHMGEALDIVNVVLTHTIALGSLITAVVAWRSSRPRSPQVRLERDGVVVILEDGSAESVEQILNVWNESTTPAAVDESNE
ncbi:hypothetical protein [Streptomyces sp. NPDC058280]|uniref:effector-associated constant component EACC1 n=1 Tax=Streptomyces sp. NPDC058280 TaxID=3346419 RepID=UPI0036E5ABF4